MGLLHVNYSIVELVFENSLLLEIQKYDLQDLQEVAFDSNMTVSEKQKTLRPCQKLKVSGVGENLSCWRKSRPLAKIFCIQSPSEFEGIDWSQTY